MVRFEQVKGPLGVRGRMLPLLAQSNHAFGLAVDVNSLANPAGTPGDIPGWVARH